MTRIGLTTFSLALEPLLDGRGAAAGGCDGGGEPGARAAASTQYSENTLVLLVTLGFAAAFAAWRRGGLARWALAGALFGLVLLTRPNTVTLLPGLALGFALALHRERRRWVLPLLTAGVAALLVISPWVIRNQRVHHRWFFVATGGGRQFWAGNNPAATGASNSATPFDPDLLSELARLPDQVVGERLLYERGKEFVRQQPGRAAWLYAVKLGNLFALYPETYSRSMLLTPASRLCGSIASAVIFLARCWPSPGCAARPRSGPWWAAS